ncbi:MAG: VOC family protein [Bacteroidota bacterium]
MKLSHIDHVAIRVRDLELSAAWYERVLGMQRFQPPEWQPFPVFMVLGDFGIALFPVNADNEEEKPRGTGLEGDHYAFRSAPEDFQEAINHFRTLGIPFIYKNHIYFESIYFYDPDGHELEITSPLPKFFGQ